jgi:hypothetical protein
MLSLCHWAGSDMNGLGCQLLIFCRGFGHDKNGHSTGVSNRVGQVDGMAFAWWWVKLVQFDATIMTLLLALAQCVEAMHN